MFITHDEVARLKNKKYSTTKVIGFWVCGLEEMIDYIDENRYEDIDDPEDELMSMDNMQYLGKEIVKTIIVFKKLGIVEHKSMHIKKLIARIMTRHLFTKDIELTEKTLLSLLNFIGWDCSLLFDHAEDWATSEESAGYDMVVMLELAKKFDKHITGFDKTNVIYSLLMAVYHCENEDAENFIIENEVKLTKDLYKSRDGMISDMVEYFNKRGVQISPK